MKYYEVLYAVVRGITRYHITRPEPIRVRGPVLLFHFGLWFCCLRARVQSMSRGWDSMVALQKGDGPMPKIVPWLSIKEHIMLMPAD